MRKKEVNKLWQQDSTPHHCFSYFLYYLFSDGIMPKKILDDQDLNKLVSIHFLIYFFGLESHQNLIFPLLFLLFSLINEINVLS